MVGRRSLLVAVATLMTITACSGDDDSDAAASETGEAEQLYVAPGGNDSGPGTLERPFATLAGAQEAVRARTDGMGGDVVVNLREGTYVLDEPLELSAATGDSGENGHRVMYQAHGYGTDRQERVTVSGGRVISAWQPSAEIPGVWEADVGDLDTRQLYVDGRRASRAALGAGLTSSFTATESGYVVDGTGPQAWRHPADVELVYRGGFEAGTWAMAETRCGVAGISGDAERTTITMDQPCYEMARELFSLPLSGEPARLGDPTDVESSPSFLDDPGSWYLDRSRPAHHVLSYLPRPGEDLAQVEVVAPVLETLVRGTGGPDGSLHDVSFRGLTFAHATWLAPNEPAGFPSAWSMYLRPGDDDLLTVPGNVVFHGAERITLEGNRFIHLGAQALEISESSSDTLVQGNEFTDVSAGGILMGVVLPDTEGVNRGNRIENNWIHHVGVEYHGASGIWSALTQDTTVAHNQINDVPYAGILSGPSDDVRDIARNNRVTDNLVVDAMQVLMDGGGIYLRGEQGESFDDGALVAGNAVVGGGTGHPEADFNIGIYTDDTINYATLRDNVTYGYVASIGGCADPFVKNLRYRDNFLDGTIPDYLERDSIPGVWPCGAPENVSFDGTTDLAPDHPEEDCRADPDCAAILESAGLTPHYRRLLQPR